MRLAQAGDRDAFARLVARHGAAATRAAVWFGAGPDTDDVVQEAFVKAWHAIDRFRADSPFRPWLLAALVVVLLTTGVWLAHRRRTAEQVVTLSEPA